MRVCPQEVIQIDRPTRASIYITRCNRGFPEST
jgi:hypothetical protein